MGDTLKFSVIEEPLKKVSFDKLIAYEKKFDNLASLCKYSFRHHKNEYKQYLIELHYGKRYPLNKIASLLDLPHKRVCLHFKGLDIAVKYIMLNKSKKPRPSAWNKGLTKDTDPRIKNLIEKGRITKANKPTSKLTKKTAEYVRSMPECLEWRNLVLKKYNYQSGLSGKKGYLEVHHKVHLYSILDALFVRDSRMRNGSVEDKIEALKECKDLWDVENGIPLTKQEHLMIHSKSNIDQNLYMVSGISGQDGSILASYLLEKGHKVIGICRPHVDDKYSNIENLRNNDNFKLELGSITDPHFMSWTIQREKPRMFFNFAAQSHVGESFKKPVETFEINASAVFNLLEAIRRGSPNTRFLQASTSEMWGASECPSSGFDENSSFYPRSPYGVAKSAAFYAVKNYREAHGLFAVNSISCNHSSTVRGQNFATRKITKGVADIVKKKKKHIFMGDLSSFRDESHALDVVKAMYLILLHDRPEDFVVASGSGATIEEMFRYVCDLADLKFEEIYRKDERFMRPSDVPYLKGNPAKAKRVLGWEPEYDWKSLLKEMYEHDLKELG
jgi:GDPmannose 4,6-dehydratase